MVSRRERERERESGRRRAIEVDRFDLVMVKNRSVRRGNYEEIGPLSGGEP